jgi:hypothetical protein
MLSCLSALFTPLLKPGGKLKNYVSFVLGVVCIYTVFHPLFSFLNSFDFKIDLDDGFGSSEENIQVIKTDEWILNEADHELKRSIVSIVRSKYNIPLNENMIEICYDKSDYSNIVILSVVINVSDIIVINDLNEMQQYLEELLSCECEVKTE